MTQKKKIQHSEGVRVWLEPRMKSNGASARPMFGCLAYFVGRRLLACVYDRFLVLKLPPPRVRALLDQSVGYAFRPFGKPAMRGWLAIDPFELNKVLNPDDLLLEAVAFLNEVNSV